MEPNKLADILQGSSSDDWAKDWETIEAAPERKPIPPGEYLCRTVEAKRFKSAKGKHGYKVTLEIIEGEHEGRLLWLDFWLTKPALPWTKRELKKLGITDPKQLDRPLPAVLEIKAKVVVQDDNGEMFNKVDRFNVIGIAKGDAFEPEPKDKKSSDQDTIDDIFAQASNDLASKNGPYGERK